MRLPDGWSLPSDRNGSIIIASCDARAQHAGSAKTATNTGEGNQHGEGLLGVPFMDAEHEALFAMYRALPAMVSQSPRTDSAFANGFRELLAYARYHFAHEEEIMLRLAFPGYADHQRQHATLLKDGDDFLSNIQTYYEAYDCLALTMYVRRWLRNHIDSHDTELAAHLVAAGPDSVIAAREMIVPRTAAALAARRAAIPRP